jgi:glycolate oxidase FAD binding subunit
MQPQSETELSQMIADATGPLRIMGGGTRPIGRATGEALSTTGLSGITLHEPGALTLVAKAGTPVAEIESVLAAKNQRLAFEPMDHRTLMGTTGAPTIGGVVAANVSGPRRISVGACRDFLLGVRFVDGAGNIIKNGGRVMKNVTGYDLVKLMAGAYGTLGVLTEVSFKVLPSVEAEVTLALTGLDDATAIKAMSATLGSPYEVTGVAHNPESGLTQFRLEGFDASVAYRADDWPNCWHHLERWNMSSPIGPPYAMSPILQDAQVTSGAFPSSHRMRPASAPRLAQTLSAMTGAAG